MSPRENLDAFKERYNPIDYAYRNGTISRVALAAWREQQLRTVLKHAKDNSVFYASRLDNVDVDSITIDQLEAIPFTTKDDLREQMADIMSGTIN
ncbi:phenylacetate--CoA ligase family protein, partial [Xanthomonas translucens pv. translucens]|nr:phenylacetate--CoA ligase family protein [Xanthomonas translucens pv. translucens]MCS3375468.1 phenylacetate--CoA ligase family protein [Xanthomonas translucens pv. translucens]MCT8276517.1 phenylacetate--CoA ligase family protein [Xanthomonas translucens pv. translucens]MCT8280303.1 phenylacetate--CoA ligase family protein [Xanthomonas translucens pv. translucens]MCT8291466.1 phenylacetate--CoA ligase family protein [Xanthomonas translucens pv. translucens]